MANMTARPFIAGLVCNPLGKGSDQHAAEEPCNDQVMEIRGDGLEGWVSVEWWWWVGMDAREARPVRYGYQDELERE